MQSRVHIAKKKMSGIRELTKTGKELGYEGEELRRFVQAEREREVAREQAERDMAREQAERDMAREQAEREREVAREQAKREVAREQARLQELELQVRIEEARRGTNGGGQGIVHPTVQTTARAPVPKLPKFEEGKDEMDAFLERFERFATSQDWPREGWAINVSSLLTGTALQVYASLSETEAGDYEGLKMALLKRFDLNEEGYRRKFRNTKPMGAETASQFVSRLENYLNRWVDMTGAEKSYKGIKELILREQFLGACHEELAVYLQERMPDIDSVGRLAQVAEQYVDAHGCAIDSRVKRRPEGFNRMNTQKPRIAVTGGPKPPRNEVEDRKPRVCFVCHRPGHVARECKSGRPTKQWAGGTRECENRPLSPPAVKEMKVRHRNQTQGLERGARLDEECDNMATRAATHDCTGGRKPGRANGESDHDANRAGGQPGQLVPSGSMPTSEGYIGDRKVKVLRDTGCSSAVVRLDLVDPSDLTGEMQKCVLMDGTTKHFPVVEIWVDTPYLRGEG